MAPASPKIVGNAATLQHLLATILDEASANRALATLVISPELDVSADRPSRAQVSMALNAILFMDLLGRVPTAARYAESLRARGARITVDHGAVRAIDGPCGGLPEGYSAFARFLEPLGYHVGGVYPLPALRMTGRAFTHRDFPEAIPQFFVSELHMSQFPEDVQEAGARVFGASHDPLDAAELAALDALAYEGDCTVAQAKTILKGALRAFGRQHPIPALADYETLLEHSKEGAWIATEGNAFNHATTRVPDVAALAEELKQAGYPMKPTVEISQNGRVRQTAILADKVSRRFRLADGGETTMDVPGSFYEFITRDINPETGRLDLSFDSGNATGIFAVTRAK